MAILPGIFQRTNADTGSSAVSAGRELWNALTDANHQAVLDMIDGLSVGDTLLGKVLSQSGKNLRIQTQDGLTLTAQNDARIQMDPGSTILFEVKKNNGREISISPLYQNTSAQKTAETALNQAGIPVTERSLELVGRNMEYGNPIDRQALAESYKDAALFPEASIKTIVDLQQMGMEVNEKSITQYTAFANLESSVAEGFSDIADSLLESLKGEIADLMQEGEGLTQGEGVTMELSSSRENGRLSMTETLVKLSDSLQASGFENDVTITAEEFDALVNDAKDAGLFLDHLVNHADLSVHENGFQPLSVLKELMTDLETPTAFLESSIPAPEAGTEGAEALVTSQEQFEPLKAMADFLSKDSVSGLFEKSLSSQWSLDKDKLGNKEEVKDLYSRLFSQTRDMLDILSQNTDKSQAVSSQIETMRSNLDFTQALNDYVPYVQIPFHSDSAGDQSELYVYTNKRSLADGDGEVSAFIHLDMEHLGPTDVYVKLKEEHVTTNFTVADEDTLTLIEHNLDLLDRRLKEKGYSFESSVKTGKNETSPMQQMLSDTQRHLVLADTSFDARV